MRLLAFACASAVLIATGASAQTDENGVIQYVDSIPPAYCFLQIATAKCPTEADRRASSAAEADKRARDEIARHDRMLLETYLSVAEIEDLRDRRLALLESQIELKSQRLFVSARADQAALKKSFDDDIARFRQLKGV